MKTINLCTLIQKYNIIPIILLFIVVIFVLFQESGVIENFREGRRKKKKKKKKHHRHHKKCKHKVIKEEVLFMPPPFKVKENQNVALPHHFPQTDAKKIYEENKDDIKTSYTQFLLDVNRFDDVTAILMRDTMAENAKIPQTT